MIAVRTCFAAALAVAVASISVGCSDGDSGGPAEEICVIGAGTDAGAGAAAPDFVQRIGCRADFDTLASLPLDSSIPGARSVKFVIDLRDMNTLYFQNSKKYKIHWEFAREHLSGNGKPVVPALTNFNQTEYYSTARRFLLGSLTYYEGPKLWAMEIAPYDTAEAAMIQAAYEKLAAATYFGKQLYFHPTSLTVEKTAAALPSSVRQRTTAQIYEAIDYQPLNLATAIGRLRFVTASGLNSGEYLSFREIVVLDQVPNDISVVMGIITEEFQTPLSHVNVLSQNRRTPNMGLKKAFNDPKLRALEGKWVKLTVAAFEWTVAETTQAEADAWWDANKPAAIGVPRLDLDSRDLREVKAMVPDVTKVREGVKNAIPAYGGKAAHFGALAQVPGVPVPPGFGIPVYYYKQYMQAGGFEARVDTMLADPTFQGDPKVRDQKLKELRDAIIAGTVDPAFLAMVTARVAEVLPAANPGQGVRFRSSTNAEDLEGFTGAGLYTSKTGMADDPIDSYARAIKQVWASVWFFRAFEERSYRSIDHKAVGMALLVHRNFPEEEANGVALTADPFDTSGLVPGFYVNVQLGESSVVQPPPGVTTDQFIYQFNLPNQPTIFLERSSLIPAGQTTVLTAKQTFDLGKALDAIHKFFLPAYGPAATGAAAGSWYAMDVEFKFDGQPGEEPVLSVKQARPHPGRGGTAP
jgi:pyruvate,water dikinase